MSRHAETLYGGDRLSRRPAQYQGEDGQDKKCGCDHAEGCEGFKLRFELVNDQEWMRLRSGTFVAQWVYVIYSRVLSLGGRRNSSSAASCCA